MARIYFHIDLNAFFASAEVLLDPSLKGKPIAVSGHTRRSVVSTASYEARKYGVHSAMPIAEAEKLCRDLIIIPGHYHWYSELSQQFIAIIRSYTDLIEQASIDECYADVTEEIAKYERPLDLAWKIQKQVFEDTGLQCSIGVGPNMFLAKMASDMKKPMGITVLRIRDVSQKMWPLPIGEMRGVGKKTVPLLEEAGIHTIGDLANIKDIESLRSIFGRNTEEIIERANGRDSRTIVTEYDAKSMGVSETMLEDVTDYDEIRGLLRTLSRKLSARLKANRTAGKRISLRICYYNFRNADRSMRSEKPLYRSEDLFQQACALFDDHWEEGEAVRLLGISVSSLVSIDDASEQLGMFSAKEEETNEIRDILKDLNKQLGSRGFVRASTLLGEKDHEH